ncbi:MAG: SprT-like domain-containing protein [Haloarculaceae archaeon]
MAAADPPGYDAITDHDDLLAFSRAYAREARREWLLDVRLDLVEWTVSTRAKRRAGAVRHPRHDDASVGDPFDWDACPAADGRPRPCTVSLTWRAFEAFDRVEWAALLRHELAHVEQYQQFGTTDHGRRFRERAAALDTSVHCRHFADPAWTFHCAACGALVARRCRECAFVREYDRYRSDCCGAPLERTGGD